MPNSHFISTAFRLCNKRVLSTVSRPNKSTVQKGTEFEENARVLLRDRMSMSLTRVGGKEDGGIDLVGWWWLPDGTNASEPDVVQSSYANRRRIRVIGQCKAEKKKLGPNYVRELEGVLSRSMSTSHIQPSETDDSEGEHTLVANSKFPFPMVALLVSQSAFTKSALLRAHSSPIPFFLLHLPAISSQDPEQTPNVLGSGFCNAALSGKQTGLLKGNLEVRWEISDLDGSGRPGLWWQGWHLPSWIPDLQQSKVTSTG